MITELASSARRQDFERFYKAELLPYLEPLEAERKRLACKIIFAMGGAALVCLIPAALLTEWNEYWGLIAGAVILASLPVIYILLAYSITGDYQIRFKKEIIQRIVKYVDDGLNSSMELGIKDKIFDRSSIFENTPNVYSVEEAVFGTIGETEIGLSQVRAKRRTGTPSHGHYKTIFSGIFVATFLQTNFRGQTVVLPDRAERWFGEVGRLFQRFGSFREEALIRLEDEAFEKAFAVYTTDEAEARSLLTPQLMERIVAYWKQTGRRLGFSFRDQELYVAIFTNRDVFEPHLTAQFWEWTGPTNIWRICCWLWILSGNCIHRHRSIPNESGWRFTAKLPTQTSSHTAAKCAALPAITKRCQIS